MASPATTWDKKANYRPHDSPAGLRLARRVRERAYAYELSPRISRAILRSFRSLAIRAPYPLSRNARNGSGDKLRFFRHSFNAGRTSVKNAARKHSSASISELLSWCLASSECCTRAALAYNSWAVQTVWIVASIFGLSL